MPDLSARFVPSPGAAWARLTRSRMRTLVVSTGTILVAMTAPDAHAGEGGQCLFSWSVDRTAQGPGVGLGRDPSAGLGLAMGPLAQASSTGGSRAVGGRTATPTEGSSTAGQPPLTGAADRLQGRRTESGYEARLEGSAWLEQGDMRLQADRIDYREASGQAQARGQVQWQRGDTRIEGPAATVDLNQRTGHFERPDYTLPSGHGRALSLEALPEERYRLEQASFSTCRPGAEDWEITAEELNLDRRNQEGHGRWASLRFLGVKLFKAPVLWFPLGDARRSGVLPPSVSFTSRVGAEVSVPYYFNLAPNYDLLVTPRVSLLRGLQIDSEARYLFPRLAGGLRAEWVPQDQQTHSSRYYLRSTSLIAGWGAWSGGWDMAAVSDDDYFVDYSRTLDGAALRSLPRDAWLSRPLGENWQLGLRATQYQNILDARISPPFEKLPQVTLSAFYGNQRGFDIGFYSEAVWFRRPISGSAQGLRMVAQPYVSYPVQGAGWFVTPRLSLNAATYQLEANPYGSEHLSRVVPTFSLRAGMVFERDITWSQRAYTQTLEPQMFYVYTPYRDQSAFPVFDTAPLDFGYAQLFTENAYTGMDRIADANHVTAALVSRFTDRNTGVERLRLGVAQRFYIEPQIAELPGVASLNDRRSDLLLLASGAIGPHVTFDAGMQFAVRDRRVPRYSMIWRYRPEPAGRLFNLGVRYQANSYGQWDASFQWPVNDRWSLLGKANYSFLGTSSSMGRLASYKPGLVEGVLGVEYREDCWATRFVVQRFVTAEGRYTNAYFLQLDLLGLGRIGSDPFGILVRNIPGYQVPDLRGPTSSPNVVNP